MKQQPNHTSTDQGCHCEDQGASWRPNPIHGRCGLSPPSVPLWHSIRRARRRTEGGARPPTQEASRPGTWSRKQSIQGEIRARLNIPAQYRHSPRIVRSLSTEIGPRRSMAWAADKKNQCCIFTLTKKVLESTHHCRVCCVPRGESVPEPSTTAATCCCYLHLPYVYSHWIFIIAHRILTQDQIYCYSSFKKDREKRYTWVVMLQRQGDNWSVHPGICKRPQQIQHAKPAKKCWTKRNKTWWVINDFAYKVTVDD